LWAYRSSVALRSYGTLNALRALWTGVTRISFWSCRSGWADKTLNTLRASIALITLWPLWALWTDRTY
jgi:hypothetical protein